MAAAPRPTPGVHLLQIVFGSRLSFGRDQVIQRLNAFPGVQLTVCATLADCILALPHADGLVLYNCPPMDPNTLGRTRRCQARTAAGQRPTLAAAQSGDHAPSGGRGQPRVREPRCRRHTGSIAPAVVVAWRLIQHLGPTRPDAESAQALDRFVHSASPPRGAVRGRLAAVSLRGADRHAAMWAPFRASASRAPGCAQGTGPAARPPHRQAPTACHG